MGFPRWTFVACLVGVIMIQGSFAQFREYPPRYDYHNLPQTVFTCEGRLPGRYYADPDTDCQMFHVCTPGSSGNFRFLCPNGTVFDQEHQVCADYYQVVCHSNVGTNPLGHIFEIYKIGAKENTRNQEFGSAPARDPVYLGQNSLTEDFQVEEYNNNKLASQNALHYQTSAEKISRKSNNKNDIFYYTQSTTQRPTTQPPKPRSTTTTTTRRPQTTVSTSSEEYFEPRVEEPRLVRPQQQYQQQQQPIVISSRPPQQTQSQPKQTTTPKPAPVFNKSPPKSESTSKAPFKLDFSDFHSLAKFQYDFHHGITSTKPPATTTDFPTTTDRYYKSTTYSPSAFYTEDYNVEPNYYVTDRSTTDRTTYRTTTYVPTTTFKPTTRPPTKPTTQPPTKPSTTPRTFASSNILTLQQQLDEEDARQRDLTARKPLFSDTQFSDFKSLASFQHAFHHGFTTRKPKKQAAAAPDSQEDFKPKSETESPSNYQTTSVPRKQQVYHSTFRANTNDLTTTVNPPTFQQQPSRYNEDFFRKIENKYDTAVTNSAEQYSEPPPVKQQNRRRPVQTDNFQNNERRRNDNTRSQGLVDDFNEVSSSAAPARRGSSAPRRNPVESEEQQYQQQNNNGQYKFSRRVENARFDDRSTFATRERAQDNKRTEEIFDTAESFRRSPVANNFYNDERRQSQSREDVRPIAPQDYSPALFGRRVRPNSRQRLVQTTDEPEDIQTEEKSRKSERTRVVKRVRRPITTSTESTPEYSTRRTTTTSTTPEPELSTSKPVKKIQVRTKTFTVTRKNSDKFYETRPTTTEEPELVTASDDEIERIRKSKKLTNTTTNSRERTPFYNSNRQSSSPSFKVEDKRPAPTVPSTTISSTTRKSYQPIVPIKKESTAVSSTRSPDYDYNYYDSDIETDYLADLVSRQDKYGRKPSKNINKS